jgi:hypothetical protein
LSDYDRMSGVWIGHSEADPETFRVVYDNPGRKPCFPRRYDGIRNPHTMETVRFQGDGVYANLIEGADMGQLYADLYCH